MGNSLEIFEEQEDDISSELDLSVEPQIVVFSRDWTVETMFSQIEQSNIDLNPKFQRRNAWDDKKRCKLIESFIFGLPVPEIVLAEHPTKPKSFIVIDGKQRLLTLAGFIDNEKYKYWYKPVLTDQKIMPELSGVTFDSLKDSHADQYRRFMNADIRCTIITHYQKEDILYDIFYRLNVGSVPLSSQELRQVLNKGEFANYLFQITSTTQPIHVVLGMDEPDQRLYDIEFLVRYFSFLLFAGEYRSNLKGFLDDSMKKVNADWEAYKDRVSALYDQLNSGIEKLQAVFSQNQIGKRFVQTSYFNKVNKSLIEAMLYFFSRLGASDISPEKNTKFRHLFEEMSKNDDKFNDSISRATKDSERYSVRYSKLGALVEQAYGVRIPSLFR